MYLFGYGSLICNKSCEKTIGRSVDLTYVTLKGFKRSMSAPGKVFSEQLNELISVRFANIENSENSDCHGVLLDISLQELFFLEKREVNYHLEKVQVFLNNKLVDVMTFIADYKVQDGFVLNKYLEIIKLAAKKNKNLEEQIEKELSVISKSSLILGNYFY